jgi:phosphatidylglycerophosphatase C
MAATLVLFDFDGTITRSDTLFLFTRHSVSRIKYLVGLVILSPILVLHKLGFISSGRTKEIFLSWYFNGMPLNDFNNKGARFASIIESNVRPQAIIRILEHQKLGHRVIVVSASAENWIQHWASNNHLELLATKLQVVGGKITGMIDGANCNSEEKVNRVKSYVNIADYKQVIVYGDSKGDKPMLELGTARFYKPFRD